MPVSINERPNPNAVRTKWGWSHKDTGEQLVSAYAYFDGSYEADGGDRPNQGKPLVEGTGPEPERGKPKIDTQPVNANFDASPLTFNVAASITNFVRGDELSYKWQFKKSADSTYRDLTADDTNFSGIATDTITVTGADKTMSGDRVRCVVSVKANSVTSTPAEITAKIKAV